jgi:hypothetical protein
MSPEHLRAIKIRRVSIIRLENRPPAAMTPEQVQREIANIYAQIVRITAEDVAENK